MAAIAIFTPDELRLGFNPRADADRPWRTLEKHSFRQGGLSVDVSGDFRTDLATIPTWLNWLYDPKGKHQRGGLFHDWLYFSHEYSRWTADSLLRTIMEADGVAWWRVWTIWLAVRCFGWLHWGKDDDARTL